MSELRQARRVRIQFAGVVPELPKIVGLKLREQQADRLALEFRGELPVLLSWLAEQRVVDLQVEPLGLAETYHSYHGNSA